MYIERSLRKGYHRCIPCERAKSKRAHLLKKTRIEENPWLKKIQAIHKNVDSIETRKVWNADIAKHLWLSYSKRCALSNETLEEKDVSYVKIDNDKELEPTNAAVVSRWLVARTRKKEFAWDKDQRSRIQNALVVYKQMNG